MPMTLSEKIIARAANRKTVSAGDIVVANADKLYIKDLRFSKKEDAKGLYGVLLEVLESMGKQNVWDGQKIVVNLDEQPPRTDRRSEGQDRARDFAREQRAILYGGEDGGIGHNVMVEHGHVLPGEFIVGGDSHTCTYGALGAFATGIGFTETVGVLATGQIWLKVPTAIRFDLTGTPGPCVVGKDIVLWVAGKIGYEGAINRTLEYAGPGVKEISIESRLTMCNMAVEMIAVNAIIPADERTAAFVREAGGGEFTPLSSDADARYVHIHAVNLGEIEPQVAAPEYPANAHPVGEFRGVKVHQGFIGTCTNGRIEDLRMAAGILHGRNVKPGVRLIITPASFMAYRLAEKEGLLKILQDAGATVTSSECGLCVRPSLAAGEVCVSSGNRNYRGRMGPKESSVFLSNAATVAASAVAGEITDPRDFV
ncbi:MAG TPA: aconitase/3-isopropylmalate dehydratase large subunit family protein [Verrucomicrobiae bacterium]|nr:aconitase/3-isopropylmalate dehydratase large subunit family protein [Verrucomicrobiae bacterium]